MKSFLEFMSEDVSHREVPFHKDPKIGWWKDGDHVTLYHGTHIDNVKSIMKHGLKAGSKPGSKISMALDPHTAHGYASMHGGEARFKHDGKRAETTPHEKRAVLVYKVPRHYVDAHHDKGLTGNVDRSKLTNKAKYDAHKRSGGDDSSHYTASELQFHHVPYEYLQGYMRKRK